MWDLVNTYDVVGSFPSPPTIAYGAQQAVKKGTGHETNDIVEELGTDSLICGWVAFSETLPVHERAGPVRNVHR